MLADGSDFRLNLLKSLDISACRVEYSESPIVLLCGGPVRHKATPESDDPPIASLRHAITNLHPEYEIFRPEEIEGWQADAIFEDLMSFELELAAICSLVVIILESEGAIAELGAFSQSPELSDKIVAICPEIFREAVSFINLGILRYIAARKKDNVKSYPWIPNQKPFAISAELVGDVALDIQGELEKLPKTQVLKVDHSSHVMVLICELLRLFVALKEHEVYEYLQALGVGITAESLKGKIFLLCEFRLVKVQNYSDARFYLRGEEPYHKLRFSPKSTSGETVKPLDILRVQTECLELYQTDGKHRNRNRAILLARAGAAP